jgi:hypothetical protein
MSETLPFTANQVPVDTAGIFGQGPMGVPPTTARSTVAAG